MAQFEKGREKTGGRQKGTRNKTSADLKLWITRLLSKNLKQIEQDLKELDAKERLYLFEKLMRYVLPRQQSVVADMALGLNENELEQFRVWQRTQARFDSMTDEELKDEIERIERSINDI